MKNLKIFTTWLGIFKNKKNINMSNSNNIIIKIREF